MLTHSVTSEFTSSRRRICENLKRNMSSQLWTGMFKTATLAAVHLLHPLVKKVEKYNEYCSQCCETQNTFSHVHLYSTENTGVYMSHHTTEDRFTSIIHRLVIQNCHHRLETTVYLRDLRVGQDFSPQEVPRPKHTAVNQPVTCFLSAGCTWTELQL